MFKTKLLKGVGSPGGHGFIMNKSGSYSGGELGFNHQIARKHGDFHDFMNFIAREDWGKIMQVFDFYE